VEVKVATRRPLQVSAAHLAGGRQCLVGQAESGGFAHPLDVVHDDALLSLGCFPEFQLSFDVVLKLFVNGLLPVLVLHELKPLVGPPLDVGVGHHHFHRASQDDEEIIASFSVGDGIGAPWLLYEFKVLREEFDALLSNVPFLEEADLLEEAGQLFDVRVGPLARLLLQNVLHVFPAQAFGVDLIEVFGTEAEIGPSGAEACVGSYGILTLFSG